MSEQVFLDNHLVKVTKNCLIVKSDNKTFRLGAITSFNPILETYQEMPSPEDCLRHKFFTATKVLLASIAVAGVLFLTHHNLIGGVTLVMMAFLVKECIQAPSKPKTIEKHTLQLCTAKGELRIFEDSDPKMIDRIIKALQTAISG